ncbi:MAG: RDD family protein [Mycobacteriales bacterium]
MPGTGAAADDAAGTSAQVVPPGWGRRIGALVIDWFVALLTVAALTRQPLLDGGGGASAFWPLLAFWVEVSLPTGLLGVSLGKRIVGLAVIDAAGGPAGLVRAMLRTALVCLVIPPLVMTAQRRGLQDLAAGTAVVTATRRTG